MIHRALKLVVAPHQGIGMDLDIDAFELGQRRVDDGVQGLAGGIRDKMNMEFLTHRRPNRSTIYPLCPHRAPVDNAKSWTPVRALPDTAVRPWTKYPDRISLKLLSQLISRTRRHRDPPNLHSSQA